MARLPQWPDLILFYCKFARDKEMVFNILISRLFNSRTAIAGAIIGLLLVFFLQFKEFELYWGAVFF